MLYCPKCKKELIAVERNEVELDYCIFCEGFWFDYGEWNILTKKLISENLMLESEDLYKIPVVVTGEKKKRCPVCGRKMEKFLLFDVILDRCPDKHGVWFDKKELSTCINKMYSKSDKNQRISFLGEVFRI